jgi:FAD:protein FMN transferase
MIHLVIPRDPEEDQFRPSMAGHQLYRLGGLTMGTDWSLSYFAPDDRNMDGVRQCVEAVFSDVIAQMSTWESDSTISQFNRLPVRTGMTLPPVFCDVLRLALDIAQATDGAFNPCLGTDIIRAGFGPNISDIDVSTDRDSWRGLSLSDNHLIRHAPFQLDLSGIAKGYAVDLMANALEAFGISRFLAEIGGEFTARHVKPDGLPWWVDLETTHKADAHWRIALSNYSVATSGNTQKFRMEHGARISHIVTQTAPADDANLASVSVLHPRCGVADAWATGLFAAGAARGLALADKHNLPALFQFHDRTAHSSRGMEALLH